MSSPNSANIQIEAPKPSFVDLRVWGEAHRASFGSGKGPAHRTFLSSRVPLLTSCGPGPIDLIVLDDSCGQVSSMPTDEFLIVTGGALQIASGATVYVLNDGDAAVLPHGAAFAWIADQGTTAITMRYAASRPLGSVIVPLQKNPLLKPSAKPSADILIGPSPECRSFNDYQANDGKFVCGTWDSTPYERRAFIYAHHEIMHILDGKVTLTDTESGRSQTFEKDDMLFIECRSQCAWASDTNVTKAFAISRVGA
jgi:uncharacterized cupin superfamily protein